MQNTVFKEIRRIFTYANVWVGEKGEGSRVDLRYRVPFNCFAALVRSLFIGCGLVLFERNELSVMILDFL